MMKSICKNCARAQRDGAHLFCERTLKYVAAEHKCEHYKMDEKKGDCDSKLFLIFIVTAVLVGALFCAVVR